MEYDYTALRQEIRKKFGTETAFANSIGMHPSTLSLKLSNKSEFDQKDIAKILAALNEGRSKITKFFFQEKLQKCNA